MKKSEVAHLIDHTILKPEATHADVARIVEEGARFGTYSVCVSPSMLPLEVPEGLKVACVVGFPSGAVKPNVKAYEAKQAIADGADEIDMVINIALAKEGKFDQVEDEIRAVRAQIPAGKVLKVMRETVGEGIGVKASGGIRNAETAVAMINAGANRLGVSATAAILEGLED